MKFAYRGGLTLKSEGYLRFLGAACFFIAKQQTTYKKKHGY